LASPTIWDIVGLTNVGDANVLTKEATMAHYDMRDLSDRAEITDLVSRLGACLDEARFDEMAGLLAEDVTVRTPGGEAVGRTAVAAQARRNHPADQRFQHVITNVLVDLDGDRATARANLVLHVTVPGDRSPDDPAPAVAPRAGLGEVYSFGLARTPAGWRFARVEIEPRWLSGTLPRAPQPGGASTNASVATQVR
jgi:SnoaL-like domain